MRISAYISSSRSTDSAFSSALKPGGSGLRYVPCFVSKKVLEIFFIIFFFFNQGRFLLAFIFCTSHNVLAKGYEAVRVDFKMKMEDPLVRFHILQVDCNSIFPC